MTKKRSRRCWENWSFELRYSFVVRHSCFVILIRNASLSCSLPNRGCGSDHRRRTRATDRTGRGNFESLCHTLSSQPLRSSRSRFSICQLARCLRGLAHSFRVRGRRLEPAHASSRNQCQRRRGLVRWQDRQLPARVLRLPSFHCCRRNRRFRVDRFVFLLRISRACADSNISPHWNLGNGQSQRGRLENHDLSHARQFCSADRTNSSLSKCAGGGANVRYSRIASRDYREPNRGSGPTPHLSFVADRLRRSHLAVSVPLVGARSLCIGPGAGGNAPRRRPKKIRALRFAPIGDPDAAGWRSLLDVSARYSSARQHHLHRTRHHRAEAARLDAWLFKRDAHGLYFSWDRELQYSWNNRRRRAHV